MSLSNKDVDNIFKKTVEKAPKLQDALGPNFFKEIETFLKAEDRLHMYAKKISEQYKDRIVVYKGATWVIEEIRHDPFHSGRVLLVHVRKINQKTSDTLTYEVKQVPANELVMTDKIYKSY